MVAEPGSVEQLDGEVHLGRDDSAGRLDRVEIVRELRLLGYDIEARLHLRAVLEDDLLRDRLGH